MQFEIIMMVTTAQHCCLMPQIDCKPSDSVNISLYCILTGLQIDLWLSIFLIWSTVHVSYLPDPSNTVVHYGERSLDFLTIPITNIHLPLVTMCAYAIELCLPSTFGGCHPSADYMPYARYTTMRSKECGTQGFE
jgi:hypothetical protein